MERVNQIIKHPAYRQAMEKIEQCEQTRIFCRHGMSHAMDVARILYILVLEEKLSLQKDVVYAVALLHDIGRAREYEDGTPHDEAGVEFAAAILPLCGYTETEQTQILNAIASHRKKETAKSQMCVLGDLLYRADKWSRACYTCDAEAECYWEQAKKNQNVQY